MEPTKNMNVVWRFQAFDLVSFNVEERSVDAKEVHSNKINFEVNIDIQIADALKKIVLICSVQIFSDEKKKDLLGTIRTKGEYIIENFQEVKTEGNGIPIQIMASLVGIQVSTTRGMLKLLSKGTVFEQSIIPIINPMAFFAPKDKTL